MFSKEGACLPYATTVDKKTIRWLACQFYLNRDVFYKKIVLQRTTKMFDIKEATEIMLEVYEGVCGSHMSSQMLARKILLMGYDWSTMENDCF